MAEEFVLGSKRSSSGRPFQMVGPTTEKARYCMVEVRAKGTSKSPWTAERRDRWPLQTEAGQQSSRKYAGAVPRRQRQTKAEIL